MVVMSFECGGGSAEQVEAQRCGRESSLKIGERKHMSLGRIVDFAFVLSMVP